MAYIAGTDQPINAYVLCPRCHVSRLMIATGDDLFFTCAGCEWPLTMGAGASPLSTSAGVSAGAVALPFASGGTQFSNGQLLYVSDTTLSETVLVSGTPTATSVPVTPCASAHGSGKAVSVAVAAPVLSNQETVPNNPGWGF
jgi:hypothetical protein